MNEHDFMEYLEDLVEMVDEDDMSFGGQVGYLPLMKLVCLLWTKGWYSNTKMVVESL